uniref:Uncharacterized protein n=1 Tax=Rhizophora mucronata TaxID=61149 RepID=A0A2P2IPV5_RHIMU
MVLKRNHVLILSGIFDHIITWIFPLLCYDPLLLLANCGSTTLVSISLHGNKFLCEKGCFL